MLCGGFFREIGVTHKRLSYENEICVIVVAECSPHLLLFCAKFRSNHENAFLLEPGVCNVAPATSAVAIRPHLIPVVAGALLIYPRKPHES